MSRVQNSLTFRYRSLERLELKKSTLGKAWLKFVRIRRKFCHELVTTKNYFAFIQVSRVLCESENLKTTIIEV